MRNQENIVVVCFSWRRREARINEAARGRAYQWRPLAVAGARGVCHRRPRAEIECRHRKISAGETGRRRAVAGGAA